MPQHLLTLSPRHVIVKLLAFTAAMIVVPIGSYFATVSTIFKGLLYLSALPLKSCMSRWFSCD